MAYNVPLSSLNASDGNVTYAQGSVLRVGAGGNVNAAGSMIIDQFGNVSIGTTTVGYEAGTRTSLTLNGTSQSIFSLFTGNSARGYLYHDGSTMSLVSDTAGGSMIISVGSANPLLFGTNNTERMRIDQFGNVGIGTSTPFSSVSGRTAVSVNGTTDSALLIGAAGFARAWFYTSTGIAAMGTTSSIPLLFQMNSSEVARIDTNGNVGIGTSDVLSPLRVYANNTTDTVRIRQDGSGNALVISDAANDSTPFLIDSNGNVGVGSGIPRGRLTIAAGSATDAQITINGGTLLTNAIANVVENDGTTLYFTDNTSTGRGYIPHTSTYVMQANAAASATTISPYFGANSNVTLLANSLYEVEYDLYFLKTTNGTLTWTFRFIQAPSFMNAYAINSNVAGIGSQLPAAGGGVFAQQGQTSVALPVSQTLTGGANHYYNIKAIINTPATTGNLFLAVTNSAGSVTPYRGSRQKVTRLNTGNVGTFS